MKDLQKLFSKEKQDAVSASAREQDKAGVPITIKQDFWTDLGCAIWKLRQKIVDPETGKPMENMRHLARNVEIIWERLREIGLTIQDHTGQYFDSGQSIEVLAFQPKRGVIREIISETVRPTIYFMGQRILMGQVIVDTPEDASSGQTQP